jgi:hypothetical protein
VFILSGKYLIRNPFRECPALEVNGIESLPAAGTGSIVRPKNLVTVINYFHLPGLLIGTKLGIIENVGAGGG